MSKLMHHYAAPDALITGFYVAFQRYIVGKNDYDPRQLCAMCLAIQV